MRIVPIIAVVAAALGLGATWPARAPHPEGSASPGVRRPGAGVGQGPVTDPAWLDSMPTVAVRVPDGDWVDPPIGLQVEPVTPELARRLRLPAGLLVTEVAGRSPAELGGVQAGDVLSAADGRPLRTVQDLSRAIRAAFQRAEAVMRLDAVRQGRRLALEVTPEGG